MAHDELQAEGEKLKVPAERADSLPYMNSYHPLYYDESGLDYK
jgi:hypothetical protein